MERLRIVIRMLRELDTQKNSREDIRIVLDELADILEKEILSKWKEQ